MSTLTPRNIVKITIDLPTSFCIALVLLALGCMPAAAQIGGNALQIGVLTDMSGPNADLSGPGTLEAVQMAVEDYGNTILGKPIKIRVGDHVNKPDVGVSLARQWYDDGVAAIFDVGLSSIALSVQSLAKEKNKIVIFGSSLTSDLTGHDCSPNGISWVMDNYAQVQTIATAGLAEHADTWYFITADYVLGKNYERDAAAVIAEKGGKVIGSTTEPLNSPDQSSFLFSAQSSGAKAIGLATTTANAASLIKQAHEFKIDAGGQRLFAFNLQERDIQSIGLDVAHGYLTTAPFYWDLNDLTRSWSKRFMARRGVMPNSIHAGMYGAVLHYLKAVAAVGSDDTAAVLTKMKETPINDFMTSNGSIRKDGRVIRDVHVFQVKSAAESTGLWDIYKLVSTISGQDAFRPLSKGGCALASQ
jgi:branched-chain amino acid transport system substrate-binding protein